MTDSAPAGLAPRPAVVRGEQWPVRARRVELGLSQVDLAERAGMTQSALSRLEAGAVVTTFPVLDRVSAALDAKLVVTIYPHAA